MHLMGFVSLRTQWSRPPPEKGTSFAGVALWRLKDLAEAVSLRAESSEKADYSPVIDLLRVMHPRWVETRMTRTEYLHVLLVDHRIPTLEAENLLQQLWGHQSKMTQSAHE
jgi:hypothetical protein